MEFQSERSILLRIAIVVAIVVATATANATVLSPVLVETNHSTLSTRGKNKTNRVVVLPLLECSGPGKRETATNVIRYNIAANKPKQNQN
jgi:hypothetical protein